jgi:hypothetical protein
VNPDALEVCSNGVDDDCDPTAWCELDLSLAPHAFFGEGENDQAGGALALAGDINGDGFPDLLVGADEADPDGDGVGNLLEYAAGRDPLTADGNSILITRWDGETGRFVVRYDKSPGVSDLAYGFEARNGLVAGEAWSGASLEVLTDNEAVLEAADVSAPTEARSRMIRLRITRQ